MKSAIVIGSGIAGLAVALRLSKESYKVTVIESSDKVGGKVDVVEKGGYRWDAGPSLFTMPHLVDELFELFDEKASHHFTYKRKETVCNYFWEDGTKFSAHQSPAVFAREASKVFNVSAETIEDYLQKSAKKYALTAPIFLDQSLHKFKNYFSSKVLSALLQSKKLDITKSLHQLNQETFEDFRLIQLFDRFATYNGSSPYQTPGIMSMIPTLEMQFGTFFPKGGMRSIINSLYSLALRKGIDFKLNERVEKLNHKNGKITGVKTEKSTLKADVIISNADVYFTYKNLLSDIPTPKRVVKQERSSSALIFYWGIKKQFPSLDLHNIFFSSDYEKEFEALFSQKRLSEDLTIYINISSKEEKGHAPIGSENWFVMVNAPSNEGQDWEKVKEEVKANIIRKLNRMLGVNIKPLIEEEEVLDPIKIENKTNSFKGSLYGTSSNSKMAAFLRHANFSNKFKNLYFCGGSVHPGGGIPLCFKSAKIVADLISKS